MKIPQPIPYHGSKRNFAKFILLFFPDKIETLIEPFAGSSASEGKHERIGQLGRVAKPKGLKKNRNGISVLKERLGLVTSLPHSVDGYLTHYVLVLLTY